MAKTNAQRQREKRQRQREAGIPDFNYPALTDVSTGGIGMDVLQIATKALLNCDQL
ncbi:TPA: hypothetical protein ACKRYQ_000171 [Pseudomonas aeruginosa]